MYDHSSGREQVKIVFFDLGGVLVQVHFERFVSGLAHASGLLEEELRAHLQNLRRESQLFDMGQISSEDFYHCLLRHLHIELEYELFKRLYTHIFSLQEEVAALAQALKGHVRLSIISNTDPLHYNYIISNYPFFQHFEKPVTSFAAGALKPNPAIYRYALDLHAASPDETLFIDDVTEHVLAARELGMRAIVFLNAVSLRRQLAALFPHATML